MPFTHPLIPPKLPSALDHRITVALTLATAALGRFLFSQSVSSVDKALSHKELSHIQEMADWIYSKNHFGQFSWFSDGDFHAMPEFEARFGRRLMGTNSHGNFDSAMFDLFTNLQN